MTHAPGIGGLGVVEALVIFACVGAVAVTAAVIVLIILVKSRRKS